MTFGLEPPKNVNNLFGNWLKGIPKKDLIQVWVGVCAIIWAIWNTRNDFIFNKPKKHSFMQVISLATHWIRMWSYLQQEEQREAMDSGCNRLETVARDLFSRCGWRLHNRISNWCISLLVLFFAGSSTWPPCAIRDLYNLLILVYEQLLIK
jgi:hypothetical protein